MDYDLNMYILPAKELDYLKLGFVKWLVKNGRLDDIRPDPEMLTLSSMRAPILSTYVKPTNARPWDGLMGGI